MFCRRFVKCSLWKLQFRTIDRRGAPSGRPRVYLTQTEVPKGQLWRSPIEIKWNGFCCERAPIWRTFCCVLRVWRKNPTKWPRRRQARAPIAGGALWRTRRQLGCASERLWLGGFLSAACCRRGLLLASRRAQAQLRARGQFVTTRLTQLLNLSLATEQPGRALAGRRAKQSCLARTRRGTQWLERAAHWRALGS